MELIRISDSRLKISLTRVDVERYGLDTAERVGGEGVDAAIRSIIDDVNSLGGTEFSAEEAFIQMFSSRAGGCELFVTYASCDGNAGYGISESAYRFDKIGYLIEACRRLSCGRRRILSSEVWRDELGKYHLFLIADRASPLEMMYMNELGERENVERAGLYLREHGRALSLDGAVEAFSEL